MTDERPDDYFRRRIAEEANAGEPELTILARFVRPGGTAVDVGANEGIFAFALSELAASVHAFEANPDYAALARQRLGMRAQVHEVALSDKPGRAQFYVPLADDGGQLHLAGNLKNTHAQFPRQKVFETEVATLDQFGLDNVSFIKVDVEGSELEVLEGGRATILRDHPPLLLELLSGTYEDPLAIAMTVCEAYGYEAFVVDKGALLDAAAAIRSLGSNTTWGSHLSTRNVLFLPRG